jgi:hypothetical protein
MFVRRRIAHHYKLCSCLLLHGERNVIEAALCLVIDAYRAAAVALKADVAKILCLRNNRCRRHCQGHLRIRLR